MILLIKITKIAVAAPKRLPAWRNTPNPESQLLVFGILYAKKMWTVFRLRTSRSLATNALINNNHRLDIGVGSYTCKSERCSHTRADLNVLVYAKCNSAV
jgi:hypothetical protein